MASDPIKIQVKRGADASRRATTPASGEPGFTTDSDHLGGFATIGDGATPGGVYPGAGNAFPPSPSGRWIAPPASLLAAATAATSPNILLFMPVCFPGDNALSFSNLGVHVIGAGSAGQNCRVGLYDSVSGKPKNLIADSGNLSVASTGFKSIFGAPTTPVRPGWYWTAFVTDSSTATFEVLSTTGYGGLVAWSSSATKRPTVHWQIHTFGALPSTATPAGVSSGAYPLVHVQL